MSGVQLHHTEAYSTISVDLGGIRGVAMHLGLDHTRYADLVFAHGTLSMAADDLSEICRRGHEALISRHGQPDCSGIATHLGDT